MNWNFRFLSLAILVVCACQPAITSSIEGTWMMTSSRDFTTHRVIDLMEFKSNGEFELKLYDNHDSLLEMHKGNYQLNKSSNTLLLNIEGVVKEIKVTLLNNDHLIVQPIKGGYNISYTRVE